MSESILKRQSLLLAYYRCFILIMLASWIYVGGMKKVPNVPQMDEKAASNMVITNKFRAVLRLRQNVLILWEMIKEVLIFIENATTYVKS